VPIGVIVVGPANSAGEHCRNPLIRRQGYVTLIPTACPPSTTIRCPVANEPLVELSHNTVDAISSGLPKRPIGSCAIMLAYPWGAPAATR
jgi:hypothetical protein